MDSKNIENVSSDESHGSEKRKSQHVETQTAKKKSKTTTTKKTGGTKKTGKSNVWADFEKFKDEDGNQRARCKHCSKEFAAEPVKNGTSSLGKHNKRCEKHPDYLKNQSNIFIKKGDDGEGGSCEVKAWKYCPKASRRAIAEMVIIDEQPFSSVEHTGFRRVIESFCLNFKMPSRFTIARDIAEIYLEEKGKLKSFFAKSSTQVCLTTDTWTSNQRVNYMCVTAHFIDDNWVLHKRIINFKQIFSHKGDEIGRSLIQCLKEWDIENVLTITADNASANDVALEFLKSRLDTLLFEGRYLHIRCMAHIINLIVKDGLRDGSTSINRIRDAIRYIRFSPQRLDTFKKCVKAEKIESKALISLDMPTRWNSTWEMLDKAEKLEKAFYKYDLMDKNYKNDLGEDVPKITDFHYARQLASVLDLFQRKTTNASATKSVTVNLFFNDIMGIDKHLRKMKNGNDFNGKVMGSMMLAKFDKYWRDLPNGKSFNYILYIAAILDPRLKVRVIQFGFERIFRAEKKNNETENDILKKVAIVIKSIKDELEMLFKHYESKSQTQSPDQVSQSQGNFEQDAQEENDFFIEFKSAGSSSSYKTKSELDRYLDDEEEDNYPGFNILHWWKAASSKYPILAKMAKDILAIPISSVASEEAFSTGGRVVEIHRTSLSPPIVEALICTEDWIRDSSKKINYNEDSTEFDDIGKEIYDKVEPDHMNLEID